MSDISRSGPRRPALLDAIVSAFSRLEDGIVLRTGFFVLLGAVSYMLYADFSEMNARNAANAASLADPALPAIDRPEIDPNDPAFFPHDRMTADPDLLRQPLSITRAPGGVLLLTGTITPGIADKVRAELSAKSEQVTIVSLNSPGGSVTDAMAIGRMIRDRGYDTFVGEGSLCASSCPLAFAGGLHRAAGPGAIFGLHQIFAAGGDGISPAQASSDAQMTTAGISRYLDRMGVDPDIWLRALETPPDRLFYLLPGELMSSRLVSDMPRND